MGSPFGNSEVSPQEKDFGLYYHILLSTIDEKIKAD